MRKQVFKMGEISDVGGAKSTWQERQNVPLIVENVMNSNTFFFSYFILKLKAPCESMCSKRGRLVTLEKVNVVHMKGQKFLLTDVNVMNMQFLWTVLHLFFYSWFLSVIFDLLNSFKRT